MKKLFIYCSCLFAPVLAWAQTPPDNLQGVQLQTWIKQNYFDGKHIDLGYNGAREQMYGYIDKAADGKIECVYTGFKQDGGFVTFPDPINAEHTVPQSFFGEALPMRADLNHLFPTHMDPNSARGNEKFLDVADAQTTDWWLDGKKSQSIPASNIDAYSEDTANGFEPRESHKGNVARAVFYFYTVYPTQAGTIASVADVNLLYQWHLNDPVDATEITRNARVKEKQGNGNPYIENPSWVFKAWKLTSTGATQVVSIKSVRDAVDAAGVSTNVGEVEVTGIFHGANINPGANKFQFSLIDATGAITVRNGGTDLGIAEFAEGDEVTVKGTVSSFNGLMQIAPTSIVRAAQGKSRVTPKTVTALGEATESDLIKLESVSIVDKTKWLGSATNTAGFNMDITVNGATMLMRIDKSVELAKMTFDEAFGGVTTGLTIVGLGGQFDNATPYDAGYQFAPYKKSDITGGGPAIPTIKSIRDAVDAAGVPTTVGEVTLKGIVHGANINPGTDKFQYSLIDGTGAITIRNNGTALGIADLAEGDEITIKGLVSHFNGLMQIAPASLVRSARGLARVSPKNVTLLNEVSESDLVKMQNVAIVDKTKWLGSATNTAGFNMDINVNGTVWLMRIDKSTELAKMTYDEVFGANIDGFTIAGLGGQFDNATPFDAGYQFLPYKKSDISRPTPGTTIKSVRDAVTAAGVPTTVGEVTLKGVFHGTNINPGANKFQYSLIDATGAITIRNNGTDLGIAEFLEGDEVTIKGPVSHFNGLMQIAPTSVTRSAQGQPRQTPRTVTVLNEVSESDFVKLENVKIADKTKWLGSATNTAGFNMNIEVNGVVYIMRIDKSVELAKMTYDEVFGPDTDGFTILGLGGQFDNTSPYDGGYQFAPYKKSDISLPINFKAEFADPGIAVLEHEGTFEVGVKISKAMTTDQTITVSAVNVSASDTDYTTSPALVGGKIMLTVPAGQTTAKFSVSITDDTETEALEFLEFEIAGATGGGVIGTQKVFEVDIYDNDVKDFTPIANIRKNDAAGEPEMLLNFVKIAGLVYGKNTHAAAGTAKREFTLIGSADRAGILARYDGTADLGYTVAEGDSVVITGEIDIMEGMTVIVPFKIEKMASAKKILDPRIVTGLIGEKEESDLIKLKTVTVVSGWGAIKNGGYDVVITDGARDYRMRIDAASGLVGTSKPGTFNVVGLGAQKDMDPIYDDFYSIKPRAASDIQILTANEAGIEGVTVKMYPNPAANSFTVEASGLRGNAQLLMFNALGENVYSANFEGTAQVEVSSLQNGVYFVKIASEKGFEIQRIVVSK